MSTLRRIHNRLQQVVPVEKRSKKLAIALVILGTSLDNLNVTGSITSLFSIYEHFDANTTTVSWTLSAYSLTLGSFILVAGKVTDLIGPHNVFVISAGVVSLCALVSAVIVKSVIALIVFRAFQGMAAAFLVPSSFALAGNYFQGKDFYYALTGLIMAICATYGLGMLLGGVFSVTSIGYKGLYYLTFGISFIVFVLLYFLIVPVEPTEAAKKMKFKNLDFYGSSMFIVSMLLIILAFTESGVTWNQPVVYVCLPIGVLVLLAVLLFELWFVDGYKVKVNKKIQENEEARVGQIDSTCSKDEAIREECVIPEMNDWRYKLQLVFPRDALQVPNFLSFLFATPILYIPWIVIMTGEVQYWLYVEGNTPLIAGLKIFPISITFAFGCLTNSETFIYKYSMKYTLIASTLPLFGLAAWISQHDYKNPHSYWIFEFVPLMLYGYISSVYFNTYLNAVLRRTPPHLQGVVSGLLQTTSQVAICFGNAIVTSILGELSVSKTSEQKVSLNKSLTIFST